MRTFSLMAASALTLTALVALAAPAAASDPLACGSLVDGADDGCRYYLVCVQPDDSSGWTRCTVTVEDPRYWPCTCDPMPPILEPAVIA